MEGMETQLLETWNIHHRIQLYLLEALPPEVLPDAAQGKGRTVADHFAHVHNVRLMWLKASAPELLEGLEKIEKDPAPDKDLLMRSLQASGPAIERLLQMGIEAGGKIKGFKPNVVAFLGYLISHESYHVGKIDLILRMAGHSMDDKIHFGMWEWGVR